MESTNQEILRLQQTIQSLKKEVDHQQKLLNDHIIPKKYLPKEYLKTDDPTLTTTFTQEFETIFFKHLASTIASNIISLEVKSTRLQSLTETSKQSVYAINYSTNQTDINNSTTTLTTSFHQNPASPTPCHLNRKRKNNTQNTENTKHKKTQHFLEIGLNHKSTPP